jgi:hypothetical protein
MTDELENERQDSADDWVEPISLDEVADVGEHDYQTKAYQYWLMLQQGKEKED